MRTRREARFSQERADAIHRYRLQEISTAVRHGDAWNRDMLNDQLSLYSMLQDKTLTEYDKEKLIRRIVHDNMASITAVRTPSAHGKHQGRQGAKKVRQIEHATSHEQTLTPEGRLFSGP